MLENVKKLIKEEMKGITYPPLDKDDKELHIESPYNLELKKEDGRWYLIDSNEELGSSGSYYGMNDVFNKKLTEALKKDGFDYYDTHCPGRLLLVK